MPGPESVSTPQFIIFVLSQIKYLVWFGEHQSKSQSPLKMDINFTEVIKRNKYYFLLLFVCITACFGTLIYAPIFDFADEFFPKRWFMMNALENGFWPFWCPYRSMGIPAHADPQSSVFYLPFWLLALIGHYNPYFWGVEFIFHVYVAGCGFFCLSHLFSKNDRTCFVVACCYMLSGVFTGNTQHYSWIIAMAWLPWIFHFFFSLFENPSIKNSIGLSFSLSLLFTGGYSGFAFILFYFFIAYAAVYFTNTIRKKDYTRIKPLLCQLCLSVALFVLMALPSLISFAETTNYVTRGNTLTFKQATAMAFIPKALLTLFFPWMSSFDRSWMPLDISMRSIFIGVLTVYFFIIGLAQKKNTNARIMLVFGIICLLLSFGNQLPIYRLAYKLPFIGMLRFQTIFRCFFMLSMLILAIMGIDAFVSNFNKNRKSFLLFLAAVGLMYIIVFITNAIHVDGNAIKLRDNSYHWAMQSVIYIVILSASALLTLKKGENSFNYLSILIVADIILSCWLCLASTGYQEKFTNKQFCQLLASEPKEYPIPEGVTSCNEIQREKNYYPLWQNLGCFAKKIEWISRDPFKLKNHEELIRKHTKEEIPLYLSSAIIVPSDVLYTTESKLISADTVYTSHAENANHYSTPANCAITAFGPGKIVISTETEESRPIVVAQMYYPGWEATLDDSIPLEIGVMNKAMMSVNVPKGNHTIRMSYNRTDCKIAFIIECLTVLLSLFFVGYRQIKTF